MGYFVNKETKFHILLKALPTKGHIAWEYNPFRNYRLDEDLYEYDGYYYNLSLLSEKFDIVPNCTITYEVSGEDLIKFRDIKTKELLLADLALEKINKLNGDYINTPYTTYQKKLSNTFKNPTISFTVKPNEPSNIEVTKEIISNSFKYSQTRRSLIRAIVDAKINSWKGVPENLTDPQLREKGELVDFITNELDFSINHPVDMLPQNSYDDSVNLIMNDGYSYPKIINSRFSPRGKNTYEIVDRKGTSDTNIYDRGELFKTDTSLYKIINTFPKLKFRGVTSGGALKVGNYFFYFRLADSDGNETDFFEESGLVSIFKGENNYNSVSTGLVDEISFKQVLFSISNIDTSYPYVYVYYSRLSAEGTFNPLPTFAKINLKYLVSNSGVADILITGYEPIVLLTELDLNLSYSILDSAYTQASCLNRLFLGNVLKPEIPYLELTDLSLRFLPYLSNEKYDILLTEDYLLHTDFKGYIDPTYIYNKTGYWNKELYRLGIVYIMRNGELSPVFNIRGAYKLKRGQESNIYSKIDLYESGERKYIEFDEDSYKIINAATPGTVIYENVKGVISVDSDEDTNQVHGIGIHVDLEVILELKKYVKGFFFVRLKRIPTLLTLGIVIGLDKFGRVPTIPTKYENLGNLIADLDRTYINTTLDGTNYVSEGFLSRYKFKFENKGSSIWSKIGKVVGMVVGLAALAVSTVITFGASAIVGAVAIAGGITAAATGATMATVAAIQEAVIAIGRGTQHFNGRETKTPSGMKKVEEDDSRILTHQFFDRLIFKDLEKNENKAVLCPDYDVNLPYLNNIFTNNEHYIEPALSQSPEAYFCNRNRHFFIGLYSDINNTIELTDYAKFIGLTDNLTIAAIGDLLFRARAGEAEEAHKYLSISSDHLTDKDNEFAYVNNEGRLINSDIVRGSYGPYLATDCEILYPAETINIYVPGYKPANYEDYIKIRINDTSSYFAITHRMDILNLREYLPNYTSLVGDDDGDYEFVLYRGDCYICLYTHRLNRNFNDPSAPYNDELVDDKCWKKGYDLVDTTKYDLINSGDVNAVQLGMWVTFRVRSQFNLNIPTNDDTNISERLMTGHDRTRYPLNPMSVKGSYKIADSLMYNKGFAVSVGNRHNTTIDDKPYLKDWYGTRIMYSNIQVSGGYKNGFRLFWSTNCRDYALDYGSIIKLIDLEGSLFCVFEHGLAVIPVNERSVAGSGDGGNVYINTSNVLPQNPKMISDTIGSLWKDSVIKTERGIIYGVDTVAKKIWMYTGGNEIRCISDFCIQEFLNNNISLSERELEPVIGIRNVKTHYNAFKHDIMFTFYDNIYDFEEKAWNLCWNEIQNKWITFYSWIPSYSENIYNQYFSFDRNTSKYIAKLGISKAGNDFSDGVVLSNNILNINDSKYININSKKYYIVGYLDLANRTLPQGDNITYNIDYKIERDIWGNFKEFYIFYETKDGKYSLEKPKDLEYKQILVYDKDPINLWENPYLRYYIEEYIDGDKLVLKKHILDNPNSITKYITLNDKSKVSYQEICRKERTYVLRDDNGIKVPIKDPSKCLFVKYLNIKAHIEVSRISDDMRFGEAYVQGFNNRINMDAGYYKSMIAVALDYNLLYLTTDFWKHGLSGIIDIKDEILPCMWYGKLHPFEFEFIIKDSEWNLKIFNNLHILSNKVEPESFHYEIVGECYDFSEYKKNMYIRQEATKELYQYNGSDIIFDHNYKSIKDETPYKISTGEYYVKSAIFPLYYYRLDTINEIEDYYHSMADRDTKTFAHMAGAEVIRYKTLNEYRIVNHVKGVNMRKMIHNNLTSYRELLGRRLGNMEYREDYWYVQINPINIVYNNESIEDCKPLDSLTDKSITYLTPVIVNLFINFKDEKIGIYDRDSKMIQKPVSDLGTTMRVNTLEEDDHILLIELYGQIELPEDWHRNVLGWWGDMENLNRLVKIRDKFLKVRIRYNGSELAIINAIRSLYDTV